MATKNERGEWKTPSGEWRDPKYIPQKYRRKDRIVERAFRVISKLEKMLDQLNADLDIWISEYTQWIMAKNMVDEDWRGNLSLSTFDGMMRIQIKYNDVIEFDEEIQLAKQLIDQCLIDWSQDNGNIRAIVN
jgi:hypothetical protein